jgi:hypothetical protein
MIRCRRPLLPLEKLLEQRISLRDHGLNGDDVTILTSMLIIHAGLGEDADDSAKGEGRMGFGVGRNGSIAHDLLGEERDGVIVCERKQSRLLDVFLTRYRS